MTETATSPKNTLDQRRAQHAWKAVKAAQGELRNDAAARKDYAGEAKKLPVRIMASGLGQALAFIRSKAKKQKKSLERLHEDLTMWVIDERLQAAKNEEGLLGAVIDGDSTFLRRATDETLAYLAWFNRFAEAEGLTEGAE